MAQERFVALQHRDFRLLWFGRLFSIIGSQMQLIAVNWHVFDLLRDQTYTVDFLGREWILGADALGLGGLGLVRVIPIVLFALLGGMLADTLDRRRLLLAAQIVSAAIALLLAWATLRGQATVGVLYLATAALAGAAAFDEPARQAIVANVVPRRHLTNAISLNTLVWQVASVIGPGVAGVLIARLDVGLVYAINGVSFGAVVVALLLMRYRAAAPLQATGLGWSALIDGVRFTLRTRLIWSTMLLDFMATLFSSARTMLPVVADDILGVGAEGYGLLATAQPAGAIVAGVLIARRDQIKHQGVALLGGVLLYGLATALFGLSTLFGLSYVLFALTGAGDTVSTVIRGTLRQLVTPDEMRGRMTSVNMIFFMGGPQLGELEAGAVASLLGVPFAIVSGGVATVLGTLWVAWRYPDLRRYQGEPVADDD